MSVVFFREILWPHGYRFGDSVLMGAGFSFWAMKVIAG